MDASNCPEEQVFDCQQPDVDDGIGDDNHDEGALKMIEDSPSGIIMGIYMFCGVSLFILGSLINVEFSRRSNVP